MSDHTCLLDYNEQMNLFHFQSDNPNAGKVYGIRKAILGQGFRWAFSGGYPDGYIGLKDFKLIYPEATASDRAIDHINYIRSVPEQLAEFTAIKESGHKFRKDPYHHQFVGLEYMLHYERLAVAYDPGLGKTFIGANYLAIKSSVSKFKAVVFAPLIVHPNWYEELNELTDLHTIVYAGTSQEKDEIRERILAEDWDVIITNYDGMTPALHPTEDILWFYWSSLGAAQRTNLLGSWIMGGFLTAGGSEMSLVNTEYSRVKKLSTQATLEYRAQVIKMLRSIPEKNLLTPTLNKMMHDDRDDIFLAALKPHCVILDEAHRVKGHNSKRSLAMLNMVSKVRYRYLMSGTLSLGSPLDVFMPFNIMHPLALGENFWNFKKLYTVPHKYNKHAIDGFKNLDLLKARMDPYMIVATKEECLDLPPAIKTHRYYTMTNEQIELYNAIVENETVTIDGQDVDVSLPVVKLGKLLQVLSGFFYMPIPRNDELCGDCAGILDCVEEDKFPWHETCFKYDSENPIKCPKRAIKQFSAAKIELLRDDLEDIKGKVIIWAYYQEDLDRIKALLYSMEIRFITPAVPKCDKVFESSPDIRVFLGQVSQGIGITLNSAKTTIWYSHSLKLEDRLQSMDRNLRIGQTESVEQRDYLCSRTVEESVVRLLAGKKDVRDFLQARVDCKECPKSMHCFERGIAPFAEGCVHYELRIEVEDRKGIKLRTVKTKEAYAPIVQDDTGPFQRQDEAANVAEYEVVGIDPGCPSGDYSVVHELAAHHESTPGLGIRNP